MKKEIYSASEMKKLISEKPELASKVIFKDGVLCLVVDEETQG